MDLKQRIEDLEAVQASLEELRKLNAEIEQLNVQIEEAMKRVKVVDGNIVNSNDQVFIERLTTNRAKVEARRTEVAARFNDSKMKAVEALRDEVDAELSTYRMAGERGYETQSEAMDRVGNPYMTGKNEVEMKNYERQMRIARAQEAKEKNEAALAELEEQIAEAVKNRAHFSLNVLNEKKAGLMTDIQIAQSVIDSMSTPYKAIEEHEAEYDAVYNVWKSMEDILDPEKQDAVVEASTIQATIDALHELEEIQEASRPVETRYKEMQDKAKALEVQKAEAKQAIENIKKGLENGTITGQYVESSKARLAELEQEVKDCEAQEKENADKMKKLEEEHGLKPEEPEKPATQQYDEMENLKKQTETQIAEKTADLKKLDEELAAHPEKAEEINAQKAKLEADLTKLGKIKETTEKAMSELNEKYNLGRGEDSGRGEGEGSGRGEGDGDGSGRGEGEGEGSGKGKEKTPLEKIQDLLKEQDRLDDELKKLNEQIVAKTSSAAAVTDPDQSKALSEEITNLKHRYSELTVEKNKVRIQIGDLQKKMKAEEEATKGGSGSQKPVVVKGDEYYSGLSAWDKYKMKKEAFQLSEGVKRVSLFRKALLLLPSNKYSSMAGRMIEAGEIKPRPEDMARLEEDAKKAAEEAKKGRDPFDTLTPEQKEAARKAAEKAAREAAARERTGTPNPEPTRENGEDGR